MLYSQVQNVCIDKVFELVMRMQLMTGTRANPDSSIDHEPYIFFQNFVLSSLPEFSFSLICHCLCSFLPELLFSIVNV